MVWLLSIVVMLPLPFKLSRLNPSSLSKRQSALAKTCPPSWWNYLGLWICPLITNPTPTPVPTTTYARFFTFSLLTLLCQMNSPYALALTSRSNLKSDLGTWSCVLKYSMTVNPRHSCLGDVVVILPHSGSDGLQWIGPNEETLMLLMLRFWVSVRHLISEINLSNVRDGVVVIAKDSFKIFLSVDRIFSLHVVPPNSMTI